MKEYDAVLVHGYTDTRGYEGHFGPRNKMQISAAVSLYENGTTRKLFLASGDYWGGERPTHAEITKTRLVQRGVNPEDIIIRPETTTTNAEIDLFFEEAEKNGWEKTASLATKTHMPRIGIRYEKKNRSDVDQIRAESVLAQINVRGRFPYRRYVERFGSIRNMAGNIFRLRESVAILGEISGLEKYGQTFSETGAGKCLKAKFDG